MLSRDVCVSLDIWQMIIMYNGKRLVSRRQKFVQVHINCASKLAFRNVSWDVPVSILEAFLDGFWKGFRRPKKVIRLLPGRSCTMN
jgi:hypothetical protein